MSQYDPNRMDPNRPDLRDARAERDRPDLRDARAERAFFNWNWVIGGLAALVVLFIALSFFGGGDERTAQTPPATTPGQATTGTGTASPTQSSTPNVAPTTPTQSPSNMDPKQNTPATPPAR